MTMLIRLLGIALAVVAGSACAKKEPTATEPQPHVDPFRMDMEIAFSGGVSAGSVFFLDHKAIAFDPQDDSKIETIFDLGSMMWIHFSPRQENYLLDCQRWAKASEKLSREGLKKSDDEFINEMVRATLDPDFEVSETDSALTLRNEFMNYEISNPLPMEESQMDLYFKFEELNAYHKSMTDKKLLPFPQLAVGAELRARRMVPGRIVLVMKTRKSEIRGESKISIGAMTGEEVSRVRKTLRSYTLDTP